MRGVSVSLCLGLIFQLSETVRSIFHDLPVLLSAPSGGILSEGDKRDSEGRAICQERDNPPKSARKKLSSGGGRGRGPNSAPEPASRTRPRRIHILRLLNDAWPLSAGEGGCFAGVGPFVAWEQKRRIR